MCGVGLGGGGRRSLGHGDRNRLALFDQGLRGVGLSGDLARFDLGVFDFRGAHAQAQGLQRRFSLGLREGRRAAGTATLPVETMISTVLPTATFWPGAGLVVITMPAGTVGLLAMVVPGAPARPFWRSTSRAAASVRPGRSAGMVMTLGPSEMLSVMSEFGSSELPVAGHSADGDALGDGLVLHPAELGFEPGVVELLQGLGSRSATSPRAPGPWPPGGGAWFIML